MDLDETLIFGTDFPLIRAPDFKTKSFFIYERPYLQPFLDTVSRSYALAVWSSASPAYVARVTERVFKNHPTEFVWASDRCTVRRDLAWDTLYPIKDLKKVKRRGFDLDRVLIVDDSPEKVERNYGNAIYMPPFEGNPADNELPALARYLMMIHDVPNYRRIEKRHWRTQVSQEVPLGQVARRP